MTRASNKSQITPLPFIYSVFFSAKMENSFFCGFQDFESYPRTSNSGIRRKRGKTFVETDHTNNNHCELKRVDIKEPQKGQRAH